MWKLDCGDGIIVGDVFASAADPVKSLFIPFCKISFFYHALLKEYLDFVAYVKPLGLMSK